MNATTWFVIAIVGFSLAGAALIAAVLLFLKLNIPAVIADLTGKTANNEIKAIRAANEANAHPLPAAKEERKVEIRKVAAGVKEQPAAVGASRTSDPNATTVLSTAQTVPDPNATTVLSTAQTVSDPNATTVLSTAQTVPDPNATTVLSTAQTVPDPNATTVLDTAQSAADAAVESQLTSAFRVTRKMISVGSEETIF